MQSSRSAAPTKRRAIKDNRLDDANEEVIRKRLITYENESKPLLQHYGPDLISDIDALQPPAVVLSKILGEIVTGRQNEMEFGEGSAPS